MNFSLVAQEHDGVYTTTTLGSTAPEAVGFLFLGRYQESVGSVVLRVRVFEVMDMVL